MDDTSNGTNSGPDGSTSAGLDGSPGMSQSDSEMGALGGLAATGGLLGVADAISGLGMAAAGFGAFGGLAAMGFAAAGVSTDSVASTLSSDPAVAASQLGALAAYGMTTEDIAAAYGPSTAAEFTSIATSTPGSIYDPSPIYIISSSGGDGSNGS